MRMEQLLGRVDRAVSLPVMSPVHARLTRMIERSEVSARELSEAISEDPSLTVHVLRLVNSTLYGLPRRVGTLSQAVLLLGFDTIAEQVLRLARGALTEPADRAGPLDFAAFWQHSVAVAAGARTLVRRLEHSDEEAIFVAGLLHDIGRLVLARYAPHELGRAMDLAWRMDVPLLTAERWAIGFTHCAVGARIAARWDLPDLIVDAVAFHHEPDLTERHNAETRIVQAADVLAKAMSLGDSGDHRVGSIPAATCERFGLEAGELEELMEAIRAEFNQVSALVPSALPNEAPPAGAAAAGPKNEVRNAARIADTTRD